MTFDMKSNARRRGRSMTNTFQWPPWISWHPSFGGQPGQATGAMMPLTGSPSRQRFVLFPVARAPTQPWPTCTSIWDIWCKWVISQSSLTRVSRLVLPQSHINKKNQRAAPTGFPAFGVTKVCQSPKIETPPPGLPTRGVYTGTRNVP